METRLNKFIAQAGVCSRRDADRMIEEGRVRVNGQTLQNLGVRIDDEKDRVEVDGSEIKKNGDFIYLMMNKPPGCLVTLKDPFQRPTVKKFLPPLKTRVYPVGRLDFDSEGLLLLTNDGRLTYRLTHPRYQVKKTYLVKVKGRLQKKDLSQVEKGVILNGRKTAPAQVEMIEKKTPYNLLKVQIHEGRKREIRKIFSAVGCEVTKLQRIELGGISLGSLKKGQCRHLTPQEVKKLKRVTGLD